MTQSLSDDQFAEMTAALDGAKAATTGLLTTLADAVRIRREHAHPEGEDERCAKLARWQANNMGSVLQRVVEAETASAEARRAAERAAAENRALHEFQSVVRAVAQRGHMSQQARDELNQALGTLSSTIRDDDYDDAHLHPRQDIEDGGVTSSGGRYARDAQEPVDRPRPPEVMVIPEIPLRLCPAVRIIAEPPGSPVPLDQVSQLVDRIWSAAQFVAHLAGQPCPAPSCGPCSFDRALPKEK